MPGREQVLVGLGVADGIAIGRAVCIETRVGEVFRFPLSEHQLDAEVERLVQAVERAGQELRGISPHGAKELRQELGGILDAHALLLEDPALLEKVEKRIRSEHVNAEWAVHRTTNELAERFDVIDDEYLRERKQDIVDVGHYLLRALQGIAHHEISEIEGDIILVADDLPPSEAVRLGREHVVGFAIGSGGRTSHTTIIARSLKVPAVSGLEGVTSRVTDEDPVIVDGIAGKVILHPTEATLATYRERRARLAETNRKLLANRDLETVTTDGVRVQLMANIDLPEEIADTVAVGADGIGLYRSEFLYIEKSPEMPSEEDHLEIYTRLAEAVAPNPMIVRTYDLGGRKLAREMMDTNEENPVLGIRGIRLTMARPAIFKTQLRAIFRAAHEHEIWVMLPMISGLEEVRAFRSFAAQVESELEAEGLPYARDYPLGVMIEVPAAAMISDHLAREVDFFSIGTNDLIQYSQAVDRNNEQVAHLYRPLHPGILRMLRFVVQSAGEAGIEVSLCGEMAADPQIAPLLIGLGLRRISVSPRLIPVIKSRLRRLSASDLSQLAERCLEMATAAEVQEHLGDFLDQHLGVEPPPAGSEMTMGQGEFG